MRHTRRGRGWETDPVVLQFNSPTKLGVAREFAELIKGYKTMTGVQYTISGVKKKGKSGPYYNLKVAPVGWVSKELYETIQKIKEDNEPAFLSVSLRTIDESSTDGF